MNLYEKRDAIARIRALQLLSESAVAATGITKTRLDGKIHMELGVNVERVLPGMQEAGLIDRRPDPANALAKHYFITQKGRDYLKENEGVVEFPAWAVREAAKDYNPALNHAVADLVGALPEFRDCGEDRIHAVSRQIAQALLQILARSR